MKAFYTPSGPQGTLMVLGSRGGSEWGGFAADPTSGIIYLNANESPEIMTLKPENEDEDQAARMRGENDFTSTPVQFAMAQIAKAKCPSYPSLTDLEKS
ncbi:MAG: hypothetical protein R3C61_00035 [Bacteroidia bacterium]